MTDITITIPEEVKEQLDYSGDDLYLSFIIETIDDNEEITLSVSQWLYLVEYLEQTCDEWVIEWFDNTLESILRCW